jgi:hypothetical protein
MQAFLGRNLAHVLAVLILIARLGDIGTTYLVTPRLTLEANPIMKRLGWPFALATLLVALLPYWNAPISVIVLVPSLLVSSSNASKIWTARTLGEEAYGNLLRELAQRSRLWHAVLPIVVSSLFMLVAGVLMVELSGGPEVDWGYWFGLGIVLYAIVMAVYGVRFQVRLFKSVAV